MGFDEAGEDASVDCHLLADSARRLCGTGDLVLEAVEMEAREEIFIGVRLEDWKAHWQHRATGREICDIVGWRFGRS